jgi:hypothetical protein
VKLTILDRAAQLDAAGGRDVDVSELRAAALESGISPEAFDRALLEMRDRLDAVSDQLGLLSGEQLSSQTPFDPSNLNRILNRPAIVAIGAALGGLSLVLWRGLGMGDAGVFFPIVIAGVVALGLVIKRGRDRSVLDFIFDLALLWVGLTFVLMLGDLEDAEQVLAPMSVIGGVAAVVGGALVALPRKASSPQLPSGSQQEAL